MIIIRFKIGDRALSGKFKYVLSMLTRYIILNIIIFGKLIKKFPDLRLGSYPGQFSRLGESPNLY